jgi:hypothetical protein
MHVSRSDHGFSIITFQFLSDRQAAMSASAISCFPHILKIGMICGRTADETVVEINQLLQFVESD